MEKSQLCPTHHDARGTQDDLRESMDDSWTVVMGPSSGTLIFRRRPERPCSLTLSRRLPAAPLSALSAFCPIASAKAWSGASPLTGEAVACFSLGKSWYFLVSGCAILQTQGCEACCSICRMQRGGERYVDPATRIQRYMRRK